VARATGSSDALGGRHQRRHTAAGAFIVLLDVRGLKPTAAQSLTLRTAHAILDDAWAPTT